MSLSPPALPAPFLASPAPAATHRHLVLPYAALLDDSCQHLLSTLERCPVGAPAAQPAPCRGNARPARPADSAARTRGGARLGAGRRAARLGRPGHADRRHALRLADALPLDRRADQVRMDDPASLPLELADAQALHALLQPWFAQDGLSLDIVTPLLSAHRRRTAGRTCARPR